MMVSFQQNIAQPVPEWDDQPVYMYLEETIVFTGDATLLIIRFLPAQ